MPPMGVRSSSSARESVGGRDPSHASRGGGAEVDVRRNLERRGIRVRVWSRARAKAPSISSVGRQMRGTPASS
jgi:hypothetical protein